MALVLSVGTACVVEGGSEQQTASSEYSCCLNGEFYECAGEEALDACFDEWDTTGCSRDPSRDDECEL